MGFQSIWVVFSFIAYASSRPQSSSVSYQQFTAVATFNNYATQGNTVCGPKAPSNPLYFGAAAGDLSANISGGRCSGSIDMSVCQGQSPAPSYQGPSCPKSNCGLCYQVTNIGPYGNTAPTPSTGSASIVVQIIDSCPASSAFNFCKSDVPADERCGSSATNSLDIDIGAYQALTGAAWNNSPNLHVMIQPVVC
ncbi:hypothetical protein MMC13_002548 [Lambiella insularis]|nr:hypothetical protein [Lambiella insularis]